MYFGSSTYPVLSSESEPSYLYSSPPLQIWYSLGQFVAIIPSEWFQYKINQFDYYLHISTEFTSHNLTSPHWRQQCFV
jgi:hypothetical protein